MKKEQYIRALAVKMILDGKIEEAIELLSEFYGIEPPKIKIGVPKGRYKSLACYVVGEKTIYFRSSREYMNPFIVLHEYYHHLRNFHGVHRGSEKNADKYAYDSIKYYYEIMNTESNRETD